MAKPTKEFETLLLSLRQAGLIVIGSVEDYLGKERSVIPKHKRKYVPPRNNIRNKDNKVS